MNRKQYNNIMKQTLQYELSEQTEDGLSTARAIFKNMGVALPQGNIGQVFETISTDNYMGWKKCTAKEAQEAADNGTAAIGISADRIVVLSAADEEEPVADNAAEAAPVERLLFGVNTNIPANVLLQNNLTEFEWVVRNKIYPNFWGRNLVGENSLTKEEIAFIHSQGCKIATIYTDSDEKQTEEQGKMAAKKIAVKALEKKESFIKSLHQGFNTITRNRGVFIVVLVSSVMTCFMGCFQILAQPLILDFADSATLGIGETVCACGMLVSGLFLGAKGIKQGYVKILSVSLFLQELR